MKLLPTTITLLAASFSPLLYGAQEEPESENAEIVLSSDVEWTHLNPKRGDLAPQAGTLWGDRNGVGATGFLLKPSEGFESPPHIHNITYRGIVIQGAIHNDDPNAAEMWMPTGSFWTQPKGHVHITAAQGGNTLAYIEIDEGPYLVLPAEESFDSGERPVNVDTSNIVWLGASDILWIETDSAGGPEVAFLWGDRAEGQLSGSMIKLPAGFSGSIHSSGSIFRAVTIEGSLEYGSSAGEVEVLEPGSYFGSEGVFQHPVSTSGESDSVLYVRTDGPFEIISNE
tara:strand:- start:8843 stop:9694 length:852 start_codon:yes stop_codon:yes gene_type:complete